MLNSMENDKSTKQSIKEAKSGIIQTRLKGMKGVVKKLESSIVESHSEQRHLLIQMHMDDVKKESVTSQLEEARKENKQLLNILQQKSHENNELSSRSQFDMSSTYSTMSVVNLQYKYEELLEKYEGLLKLMASRDKTIDKSHKDNENTSDELNNTLKKLHDSEYTLKKVCDKYMALKQRKDAKINQLKHEKETLRQAHNQIVRLLHQQCMQDEESLLVELHQTSKPDRALLLSEVQRSNILYHENILLKQEIACLKSKCTFPNFKDDGQKIQNDNS